MQVEILLVEDNSSDAELTIRALRKANLANRLHHVNNGALALDFIFRRNDYADHPVTALPKLVLLDLKMPKVDGIEVLKQIRADDTTKKIPIVIMTSSKEEQDIVQSYNLGVNSYIVKPLEFEAFSRAVTELGFYWLLMNQTPQF